MTLTLSLQLVVERLTAWLKCCVKSEIKRLIQHKGAYCLYLSPLFCHNATRVWRPCCLRGARTSTQSLSPHSPPFLFCVCNNGRSHFILIIHLPLESNPFGAPFSPDAI